MFRWIKQLGLGLMLWLLLMSVAVAAMTVNCGGTNNQTAMTLNGAYAFSGPLHQPNLTPAPPQSQVLTCGQKLSLPRGRTAYVYIERGLQWHTLDGQDYIDLGNGLGLMVEVASDDGGRYRSLVRGVDRVEISFNQVFGALGIRYRLTLRQIGPLRPGSFNQKIGRFSREVITGQQRNADIMLSLNVTQGAVLSCRMTSNHFEVTLAPLPRGLLVNNPAAEVFGGSLGINGLHCPQAGVRVRAVLSDNHSQTTKNWLTAMDAQGQVSGVGFRFKDARGQAVFLFGPETTQPNVSYQFDFKSGLTVNNEQLSKQFNVYYIKAPNGQPIEGGPIKGHARVTFSYQ